LVRREGAIAMNSVRHIFLIATAVLVLTFWFAPASLGQSSAFPEESGSLFLIVQFCELSPGKFAIVQSNLER
jgi:hypothetical protein